MITPAHPFRNPTRILSAALREYGIHSFGFLDRAALDRTLQAVPARAAAAYGLDRAGGAVVAALPYDTTGRPAGDLDSDFFRDTLGRPLAALGWFARSHWYEELANLLRKTARTLGGEIGARRNAFRIAVNSRLPEKSFAAAAGLGPVGKNTLILERLAGPGCVLGVLVLPFEPDPAEGPAGPDPERPGSDCGDCDECVRACPTGAVLPGGGMLRERCLQNWASVEEPVPVHIAERWRGALYGCDLCLAACPRFRPGLERQTGLGNLGRGIEIGFLLEAEDAEIHARFRGTSLGLGWIRPALLKRNALLAASSWSACREPRLRFD